MHGSHSPETYAAVYHAVTPTTVSQHPSTNLSTTSHYNVTSSATIHTTPTSNLVHNIPMHKRPKCQSNYVQQSDERDTNAWTRLLYMHIYTCDDGVVHEELLPNFEVMGLPVGGWVSGEERKERKRRERTKERSVFHSTVLQPSSDLRWISRHLRVHLIIMSFP